MEESVAAVSPAASLDKENSTPDAQEKSVAAGVVKKKFPEGECYELLLMEIVDKHYAQNASCQFDWQNRGRHESMWRGSAHGSPRSCPYEYLGEEYPAVLGSILGALCAIVNVIGMTKLTPPIREPLFPRQPKLIQLELFLTT